MRGDRGCGIQPASFKAGPKNWIPEACVSLQTDSGAKRLWVRSFVHCFASENVSFPNKIEADNWAMDAARAGHPLLAMDKVSRGDLAAYPWMLPRQGTPTRAIFDCFAAEAGLSNAGRGLIETGSLVAIRGILMETDRLTILSPRQIVYEREAGLLDIIPIELPHTERPIGVTTRQGWKPTMLQREFLEALRAAVTA